MAQVSFRGFCGFCEGRRRRWEAPRTRAPAPWPLGAIVALWLLEVATGRAVAFAVGAALGLALGVAV